MRSSYMYEEFNDAITADGLLIFAAVCLKFAFQILTRWVHRYAVVGKLNKLDEKLSSIK